MLRRTLHNENRQQQVDNAPLTMLVLKPITLSFIACTSGYRRPSESYDFFAPLGEFGQPRQHYHMMRRLHLFLQNWGADVADTRAGPAPPATPLRWQVRAGRHGNAFVYVNNYVRRAPQPAVPLVRFALSYTNDTFAPVTIPSNRSNPHDFTVAPGVWFVWPVNLPLVPTAANLAAHTGLRDVVGDSPVLTYATAQLVARVPSESADTIFFVATEGIAVEIAIALGATATIACPGM